MRNFGSPHDAKLGECNLSPISVSPIRSEHDKQKSGTRLDFSDQMSVDGSVILVPDTLDQVPLRENSLILSSGTPSPQNASLQNQFYVNWDVEYKQLCTKEGLSPIKGNYLSPKGGSGCSSGNEMDVSNSNTPKSKMFTGQRKNLSASFLKDDSDNENDTMFDDVHMMACSSKRNIRSDTTDAGYQTGINTMSDDSSWTSSNLYASTPTKNKIPL